MIVAIAWVDEAGVGVDISRTPIYCAVTTNSIEAAEDIRVAYVDCCTLSDADGAVGAILVDYAIFYCGFGVRPDYYGGLATYYCAVFN